MISRRVLLSAAAAFGAGIATRASAQGYPDKPIKMIVPFPPGGPIDTMARLAGKFITDSLGQQVVVENRPGAGSTIGSKAVAASPPDGYTLMFGSSGSLAVAPSLYVNAGIEPLKMFAPVASFALLPHVMVVAEQVPAKTVAEFVAYAKANSGKVNYGAGLGTPPHLLSALFANKAGINATFIPYPGAAQSVIDLVAGRNHYTIDGTVILMPQIRAGKLRAIAMARAERWPELPDVPTLVEQRLPRLHHRRLDRRGGAARHARADRRQAQRRHQRRAQNAGGQGRARPLQLDREDQHAAGVRRLHRRPGPALGRAGEARRRQNRVNEANMITRRQILAATSRVALGRPAAARSLSRQADQDHRRGRGRRPMDTMARAVAQQMQAKLGQPVVVENRPGAGTTIGAKAVVIAEPDGYTLLWGTLSMLAIAPVLYKLDYDPNTLVPVALVAEFPSVLVIPPSLPANTMAEFIAYAKANRGKLNYGGSLGTPPQLMGAMFNKVADLGMTYVPYRGGAPSMPDLIAGRLHMQFDALTLLVPLVKEGKLRAIAVQGRSAGPICPTFRRCAKRASPISRATPGPASWRPRRRHLRSSRSSTPRSTTSSDRRKRRRHSTSSMFSCCRNRPTNLPTTSRARRRRGVQWSRNPAPKRIEPHTNRAGVGTFAQRPH